MRANREMLGTLVMPMPFTFLDGSIIKQLEYSASGRVYLYDSPHIFSQRFLPFPYMAWYDLQLLLTGQ